MVVIPDAYVKAFGIKKTDTPSTCTIEDLSKSEAKLVFR